VLQATDLTALKASVAKRYTRKALIRWVMVSSVILVLAGLGYYAFEALQRDITHVKTALPGQYVHKDDLVKLSLSSVDTQLNTQNRTITELKELTTKIASLEEQLNKSKISADQVGDKTLFLQRLVASLHQPAGTQGLTEDKFVGRYEHCGYRPSGSLLSKGVIELKKDDVVVKHEENIYSEDGKKIAGGPIVPGQWLCIGNAMILHWDIPKDASRPHGGLLHYRQHTEGKPLVTQGWRDLVLLTVEHDRVDSYVGYNPDGSRIEGRRLPNPN
jgi:hypothetical protein